MTRKPIRVNETIELRYWETKWAAELFALTDKNRQFLQPWMPWIPGTKSTEDSKKFILGCRKEYRKNEAMELGIWFRGKLF